MRKQLATLEKVLGARFAPIYESLRGPADPATVESLTERTGLVLPSAVRELFVWRNGQDGSGPELYPPYVFLSLDEGLSERQSDLDSLARFGDTPQGWVSQLLPIMAFEGEWVCVLMSRKDVDESPVLFRSSEEPEIQVLYPTVNGFTEALAEMYCSGIAKLVVNDFDVFQTQIDEEEEAELRHCRFPELASSKEGVTWYDAESSYESMGPWL